jgi:hypothetical protein
MPSEKSIVIIIVVLTVLSLSSHYFGQPVAAQVLGLPVVFFCGLELYNHMRLLFGKGERIGPTNEKPSTAWYSYLYSVMFKTIILLALLRVVYG